ncbi:hypothetical protein MBM_06927 [Drepanopeziza brunnea f. sp. 'multigermtubi' MB_m1]|uniref:Lytic polysaccharide monooxygenase n=1 Tax=Marssonina brunnea f. sp. multigermtubi (strain MB_m1) TaxID=1072389 RepID=K1WP51_MARBU|nr:uncharacterized protein MBM_06927 [Drepanopeziza brunnea f. sp. 'multigermtubi' MB_m1]EKD14716.1 hypothetical protein MBM_06927 [Drepanopeziza brunnea f. sp. 'multigermtubi' MB_m1]
MRTSTPLLVLFGLAARASAHVKMTSPVPFGASSLNNSPLLADGSDFPCKQRPGVYDAQGASNIWPQGSTQSLAFMGSAVHGGGSCQVSVSYDEAPTASSTWKVIHSIEGGCPQKGVAGNSGDNAAQIIPDTYPFKIPEALPTGTAVMAWTWFNKVGNREMYMNCAPVTITAASAQRRDDDGMEAPRNDTQLGERDTAGFDALPDMFTANIGNGCGTVDSSDVLFPNPGDSEEKDGGNTPNATARPTGGACKKGGAGGGGAAATTGVGPGATPVASSSSPSPTPTNAAGGPGGVAGLPGGVFATTRPPAARRAREPPTWRAAPARSRACGSASTAGCRSSSARAGPGRWSSRSRGARIAPSGNRPPSASARRSAPSASRASTSGAITLITSTGRSTAPGPESLMRRCDPGNKTRDFSFGILKRRGREKRQWIFDESRLSLCILTVLLHPDRAIVLPV